MDAKLTFLYTPSTAWKDERNHRILPEPKLSGHTCRKQFPTLVVGISETLRISDAISRPGFCHAQDAGNGLGLATFAEKTRLPGQCFKSHLPDHRNTALMVFTLPEISETFYRGVRTKLNSSSVFSTNTWTLEYRLTNQDFSFCS